MSTHSVVGKSVYRRDATQKVTGQILHVGNIEMPGMLHVAVLRSPYPHARITRIEKSRAEALEGVAAVLTGADIAAMPGVDPYFGPAFCDQPILAIDRVLHVGDLVVAVAAEELRQAEDALQLVDVDYEPLPTVFDVREAAQPGAPLVHEELRPAGAFADLAHVKAGQKSNVCYHFKLRKGNVQNAFEEAERIFEDTFSSPPAQHMPMEPHVTLVYMDENEKINVWTATQTPSFVRTQLASTFGIPMNRIRVRVPYLGGGYGSKLYAKLEPLVTLLALTTRRPVRYSLTREEEFQTITKHGVVVKIKTAVKDGLISARHCEVYFDTGAYAEIGPRIVHKSGYTSAGPYRIPNVWIDAYCVYTNKPPAGAFRGFGVPQVIWAYDSQMDTIARALGVDSVEFRMRHALDEGEPFATGTQVRSFGLKESIRQAAQAIEWSKTRPPKSGTRLRGKGIAAGVKAVLTPSISGAIIIMNADGSVNVLSSTVEMGQGSETMMAQIVAEELGISFDQVRIVQPDTDITPYDTITAGSLVPLFGCPGNRVVQDQAAEEGDKTSRQGNRSGSEGRPDTVNLGSHHHYECRRERQRAEQHRGDGTGFGDHDGPDCGRRAWYLLRPGPYCPARYGHYTVRHHHGRKSLDLSHGQRGAYGSGQDQGRTVLRSGCKTRSQHRGFNRPGWPNLCAWDRRERDDDRPGVPCQVWQSRDHHHGGGHLPADRRPDGPRDGSVGKVHRVLVSLGERGGGRSRHGNRAGQHCEISQRGGCRDSHQPQAL